MIRKSIGVFVLAVVAGLPQSASAWSHQGHMLITRLACIRILNDPAAPQGLKDFILRNTIATPENCESLALTEVVGGTVDEQKFQKLDLMATLPDRIQAMPGGKDPIQPYGAPEFMMHFSDLEYFTPEGQYHDDLSGRPAMDSIPHEVNDPRWKCAGFVPLRREECYKNLVAEFSKDLVANNDSAPKWAGYLAHYTEDIHQPHHSTVDHKSYSYLAGKVPGVPASAAHAAVGSVSVDKRINPHGDIEYQMFENADEPLKSIRATYWTEMQKDLQTLGKDPVKLDAPGTYDPFKSTLVIMYDSYEYLPLIGRGALAAYQTGTFNPSAFFAHEETVHGQTMSVVQMIALQNAKAVLAVEKSWREAWIDSHAGSQ